MTPRTARTEPPAALPLSTELLTPEQAAAEMKISRTQLYELIGSGALPVINVGAGARRPRLRIARTALAEFYKTRAL